jgi:hypothetical protein
LLSKPGKVAIALLIAAAALLLAGCPPHVSIAKINLDPGRYAGREVTIAGQVTDSFGFGGRGVFELNDGTGSMWVLPGPFGVPSSGARFAVTGRVEQGFTFGGRNFVTILHETQRRH